MIQTNIKLQLFNKLLAGVERTQTQYARMLSYHSDRQKWHVFLGLVTNVTQSRRSKKLKVKAQ